MMLVKHDLLDSMFVTAITNYGGIDFIKASNVVRFGIL